MPKDEMEFEPLGPRNYCVWSYRMKLLLVKKQLWAAVDPGNLPTDRDAQALALIGMHVSDSYLPTIFECKTAKEAWTKLAAMLQPTSTTRRLALLRELNELRKENGEPMVTYVNRAKQLMTSLLGVGQTIDSKEMALRMLAGLPKQYDVLVTVLEASADLTFDTVVTRLIDMESKLVELDQKPAEAYAARLVRSRNRQRQVDSNNNEDNRTCWACGKRGHIKRHCPSANNGLGGALAF
jgi:hypothetical protein